MVEHCLLLLDAFLHHFSARWLVKSIMHCENSLVLHFMVPLQGQGPPPDKENTAHIGKWFDRDTCFYHGTSAETVLQILQDGRVKSKGELGGRPHTPDGVYTYQDEEVITSSMYNLGCILKLASCTSASLTLNKSKTIMEVPEGFIARVNRSAAKRVGGKGMECIHHPSDQHLLEAKLDIAKLTHALEKSFQLQVAFANLLGPADQAMAQ